jgi:hypothetical protein
MPINKEFVIRLEDRPGTLGQVCRALGDQGVNILAFQSNPSNGKGLVHIVVDNPSNAKKVLDAVHLSYTEKEVALVKVPHQPGELARAARQLGDAKININYAYCGLEPVNKTPLLILGVTDAGRAVLVLDQATAAKAG